MTDSDPLFKPVTAGGFWDGSGSLLVCVYLGELGSQRSHTQEAIKVSVNQKYLLCEWDTSLGANSSGVLP